MRQLDGSALIAALNGSPRYLGTITATTVKSNVNTAVPFTIPKGSLLVVQPDVAGYVSATTSDSQLQATLIASNGLKLAADEKHIMGLPTSGIGLQALPVAGTINLKVFILE